MRVSNILLLAALPGLAACSGSGSSGAPDAGPDGSTGADTDSDTDADTDTGTGYDTDPCDDLEFPPSNGPDGCARTLLPIHAHLISRDGSVAVGTPYYFLSDEDDDAMDDIVGPCDLEPGCYALDMETMETEMVSVNSEEEPADNGGCGESPSVSADGRFVAFSSGATNLDPLGAGAGADVYLRDRELGTTELISLSSEGEVGDAGGKHPAISADGRYVVFTSYSANLVPGDTNEQADLFLRDREEETTERLTLDNDGEEVDGHFSASRVQISDDGRYVAFAHDSVLCPDDDDPEDWEDHMRDVYLRDRQTGTNLLISRAPDGFSGKNARLISMAPDASWVLFGTTGAGSAEHYYDTASYDWETGEILARIEGDSVEFEPIVIDWTYFAADFSYASADARYVAFAGGNADLVEHMGVHGEDAFVLDRDLGTVTLVTAAEDGTPGIIPYYEPMVDWVELAISGDGKRIVFSTNQYGIVDPYAYGIPCDNTPHLVYLRDCP